MYSTSDGTKGYTVEVALGEKKTTMLLDTGSAVSVVSDEYYQKNLTRFPLKSVSSLKLKSYSGQMIPIRGYIMIPVQYEKQQVTLPLVIVKGNRPALIGRNWLKKLQVHWKQIFTVNQVQMRGPHKAGVQEVLQRNRVVFSKEPGCIKVFTAKICVKPDSTPIFCKARPVPYALKEAVGRELDRLEEVK